jgi:hypothetical protein
MPPGKWQPPGAGPSFGLSGLSSKKQATEKKKPVAFGAGPGGGGLGNVGKFGKGGGGAYGAGGGTGGLGRLSAPSEWTQFQFRG